MRCAITACATSRCRRRPIRCGKPFRTPRWARRRPDLTNDYLFFDGRLYNATCFRLASAEATAARISASENGFNHVVDERVEAVGALALVGVAGHQQDRQVGV